MWHGVMDSIDVVVHALVFISTSSLTLSTKKRWGLDVYSELAPLLLISLMMFIIMEIDDDYLSVTCGITS